MKKRKKKLYTLIINDELFEIEINHILLSGDNPDLLYQELASDNELEKSICAGGKPKKLFLKKRRMIIFSGLFVVIKHVFRYNVRGAFI